MTILGTWSKMGIFGQKRLSVEAFFDHFARSIFGHFWLILGANLDRSDLAQNGPKMDHLGTGRMRYVHDVRPFSGQKWTFFHARVACGPCFKMVISGPEMVIF